MNVKQERSDIPEYVFLCEPDHISGQTLFTTIEKCESECVSGDVFDKFEDNIHGPEQNVKIKEEIIECEVPSFEQSSDLQPKVDHDSLQEKNVRFCHTTIKKELENANEVKAKVIGDINEDRGEYVESNTELLNSHCDLPTLKDENTENPGCLAESCDLESKNANVLNEKRKPYLCRKNSPTSNSISNYKCDICSKEYSKKFSLQRHFLSHTNEKPFKCDICFRKFTQKSILQAHLITHTNQKPFKCDTCSKEFNNKSNFQRHLLCHTNEKPFKCDICSKEFNNNSNLQQHLIIHNDEKPFKCDICSKEFDYKSNFQRHLLNHTNEKSFKCEICSRKFTEKYNLRAHLITHTNQKPFKCDACSKEFKTKSNLQRHLLSHTNEKSFKCDVCSETFNHKYSLQIHLITHTN